jgi:hypothetical protein
MQKRAGLFGSLTIAAVCLSVACGDDPLTTPSEIARIQVIGPDSLKAGQSAQFVANIRQADGTTKSATRLPNLSWRSSNPSVISVSNSGMVTATPSGFGEAVITAEMTSLVPYEGTHKVVIVPRAVVTGTLEVTQSRTAPNQVSYVFALKLTESAGVPATVTALWIDFDDGWSGQCFWTQDKLGQTRLTANGTLALDPLTCDLGHGEAVDFSVNVTLTDDNGYLTGVYLFRKLSP